MLNAIGRILIRWIWKLCQIIEKHLFKQSGAVREYRPGHLRLGMRKTLTHFKRFDDGAREYLLVTAAENNDEREKIVEIRSKMLVNYTKMLEVKIVVAPAVEQFENTKYWYTNCAFSIKQCRKIINCLYNSKNNRDRK